MSTWYEEFLRSIPGQWEMVPISALGDIVSGGTPSREVSAFWNGDNCWVTPGELTSLADRTLLDTRDHITDAGIKNSAATVLPVGSLLITTRATIGAVAIAGVPVSTNQGFKSIVPNGTANSSFYYHLLKFIAAEFKRLASGSTFDEISRADFASVLVPRPSVNDQQRIAEILDTADAMIQKSEAVIGKLRLIKAGLIHDLLTRGLDDSGKLRDPVTHQEQFSDSLLGQLPTMWKVRRLEDVCVKIMDGTHFSPQSTGGPYRYLTSRNIRFGFMDLSDCAFISEEEHLAIYKRCDVQYGDVLLTKDGANTGNVAINSLREAFSLLSSVAVLRTNNCLILGEYLLQYLLSSVGQRRLKDLMSGNAITRLTLEKINPFNVPCPPIREQRMIAEILAAHDDRIRSEETCRYKLSLQKQGLMVALLTGSMHAHA